MRCTTVIAVAIVTLGTGTARAQTQEWSAIWKITNGQCGEGIAATVSEHPGLLVVQSKGNNRGINPYTREVRLAADGSGTLDFRSDTFGDMKTTVAAGKGVREIRQVQVKGICAWRLVLP